MKTFVSYSSNDREKVTRLVRDLGKEGVDIWFDEDQILPGDDLIEAIKRGINESDHYIICLSPSFDKKPPQSWVKKEFKLAMLKEYKESKNCIVPVRIKSGGGIPDEIGERAYADLSKQKRWDKNFPRLVKALMRTKEKGGRGVKV